MLLQLEGSYLQTSGWELEQAARSLGLPAPPALALPAVPPATTGCDLAALSAALGPSAAAALRAQLGGSEVASLLLGDLTGLKTQLSGYAGMIDRQISALTEELQRQTGIVEGLGGVQSTLGGLQELLGGNTLETVAAACPAAGYALQMAQNTLGNVGQQVSSAVSLINSGQSRLQGLVNAKGLADGLIDQLDARLTALPGILAVFHA